MVQNAEGALVGEEPLEEGQCGCCQGVHSAIGHCTYSSRKRQALLLTSSLSSRLPPYRFGNREAR